MSKRIIYILTSIAVTGLFLCYFLFFKSTPFVANSTAFKGIPTSSPIVLKINEPLAFNELTASNELLNTFGEVPSIATCYEHINKFHKLIKGNEYYSKLIKGKELLISLNFSGKDKINTLELIALKSKNDFDILNNIVNQLQSNTNNRFKTRKYNKVNINEITTPEISIYQATFKGILIISEKSLLIEEAIRQLDNNISKDDEAFEALLKTVGQQADLNVFINHKQADRLFSKYVSAQMKKKTPLIKTYAGWTELDANFDDQKILLSGFTCGNHHENYFANALYHQKSVNSRIEKVLPHSTVFYLSFNFSNIQLFFTDFQNYLKKRNLFFQREDQLRRIEKETGINIQDLFINLTEQETALAGITVDQIEPESGRIWVVETKSGSSAITKIQELQNQYIRNKKLSKKNWHQVYKIDTQTEYTLYKFPYPNLPKTLFGQLFSGVKANWVASYQNYLIFGDSFRTVSKAIHANVLGETLAGNIDYNKFKSNLNSRSNLNFYCNTNIAFPIAGLLFNEKITAALSDKDELRKFKSFAWQITSTGDMLYNNCCLSYNAELKSKPQTIWQSHMNATFDFKPKFVINHNDRTNKEIILQDKKDNLYLINNVGRAIWQIKLDTPIKGKIHQIDLFKNGKLQYLFNTENKLYLIDRNGNNVKNFPVNLRAKATNGVAIFDYDQTRDYRFFVACNDLNIYAYNNQGNLLKGWEVFHTDHPVTHALQHFRVEGKDYIVASDKMKDYILHRKGVVRVKTNAIYPHSINNTIYLEERTEKHDPRLVSTETNGTIHYTYFDGKQSSVNTITLSKNHFFTAKNINSDAETEYLFADGKQLTIQNDEGKTILKKRFDQNITHKPAIYSFSSEVKKIGITCSTANKIYLFDNQGTIHPGFPLDGCTPFSIGFINNEKSNFNLLVGSPDGYLYNYYVE